MTTVILNSDQMIADNQALSQGKDFKILIGAVFEAALGGSRCRSLTSPILFKKTTGEWLVLTEGQIASWRYHDGYFHLYVHGQGLISNLSLDFVIPRQCELQASNPRNVARLGWNKYLQHPENPDNCGLCKDQWILDMRGVPH